MHIWNLGYPRIGYKRQLKKALEAYWAKKTTLEEFQGAAREIRQRRWARQRELGVESVPVNDFCYYDHFLDAAYLFGVIAPRFEQVPSSDWTDLYFAMARGYRAGTVDVAPLDMTKWFNTNYHYLVPEIEKTTSFQLQRAKLDEELAAAKAEGGAFHPVLIGPWTFARLSQLADGVTTTSVLEKLVPLYNELLQDFKARGFEFVQIDEPAFCLDRTSEETQAIQSTYAKLTTDRPQMMVTTYFESPTDIESLTRLPVDGFHFDLLYGSETRDWLAQGKFPKDKILSLGVVNGRNLWASPLQERLDWIAQIAKVHGTDRLWIAPSCSLLHLPHDIALEKKWDDEFKSWIAFADQRLEELVTLKKAFGGDSDAKAAIEVRTQLLETKRNSTRIRREEVQKAAQAIRPEMLRRASVFKERVKSQKQTIDLPVLPTTTIGSFPQTADVREIRRKWKKGQIDNTEYERLLDDEIGRVVKLQEDLGLDVLVHGESERNDMVEYFGELLEGFQFSKNGWVQSYGSRCVKPPIIYGDVKRKAPMTVEWFKRAQSKTKRPMKGMLTGPVTILNWSFVREDQPRRDTAFQIGLAVREEVQDLESAGAKIVQVDEAALREGLPIKRADWQAYLKWSVESFRLCTSGVADGTQIQTHMCYSEFNDIMASIRDLDADVLLIEFARSGPAFFETFRNEPYPNHIGPGVYDIHSPRIPSVEEYEKSLLRLTELFDVDQIWSNPDCGLKTRRYSEVEPALANMVKATLSVREQLKKKHLRPENELRTTSSASM